MEGKVMSSSKMMECGSIDGKEVIVFLHGLLGNAKVRVGCLVGFLSTMNIALLKILGYLL